jgi:hypothetical protein
MKKVGYKGILKFVSIGVFPLIIVPPIIIHMHHVLLGRGGVFFGVSSFCVRCYGNEPTRGNAFFSWVRYQTAVRK